jgi:CheY-like chemotaxis protein
LRWFNPFSEYQERLRRPVLPAQAVSQRLVVVETGDSLRKLLARYMHSIEIVPVANLDEAGQEISRGPAQALLINDPSVSDALQRLGGSQATSGGTPAIICSVPGIDEAADALGVSDYLVKPVSREALLGALERLELHGKTVLIVDDQPEALLLFRRMLASADREYRVLRASNGRQALDILAEERPDVILLDLVMPEMDGFRFLAIMRSDPGLCEIPVVAISARDPSGQPIVSSALAVSLGDGLSMHQLLACIEGVISILSPVKPRGDRVPTERRSDLPASG